MLVTTQQDKCVYGTVHANGTDEPFNTKRFEVEYVFYAPLVIDVEEFIFRYDLISGNMSIDITQLRDQLDILATSLREKIALSDTRFAMIEYVPSRHSIRDRGYMRVELATILTSEELHFVHECFDRMFIAITGWDPTTVTMVVKDPA